MSTTPPAEDGFDFIRKMWSGVGMPGMVAPTLDPEEIERRIAELRSVEAWLKMNLNMLQMTIQGLEVQRSTLAAMQAMSQAAKDNPEAANPFANPALWAWPFQTASAEAAPSSEAPSASAKPARASRRAPKE